jgi:hypothetical protein
MNVHYHQNYHQLPSKVYWTMFEIVPESIVTLLFGWFCLFVSGSPFVAQAGPKFVL